MIKPLIMEGKRASKVVKLLLMLSFAIKQSCSQLTYTLKAEMVNFKHDSEEVKNSSPARKYVENLNSVLEHFGNDRCLIAINIFFEFDIQPKNSVPVVLRHFSFALLYGKLEQGKKWHNLGIIWTSEEHVSKITGNYTSNGNNYKEINHNCHVSKYFTPLYFESTNSGYCVGIYPIKFSSSSKPWACEVQLDLFMPIEGSVVKWMSRESNSESAFPADRSDFEPASDITLFGSSSCEEKTLIERRICRIKIFSMIFICADCKNAYLSEPLSFQNLNVEHIKFLDKIKKNLLVTGLLESFFLAKFELDELSPIFTMKNPKQSKYH